MNRFETIISVCDLAIKEGRTEEAARCLGQLNVARIPRHWRLPLAKICRRSGVYSLGLRLLYRIINSKQGAQSSATANEMAEYSILLLRSGAIHEAIFRLEDIDTKEVPDALLFKAYAHFSLWEYEEALPYLQKYLKSKLSDQARLVGQSNLAFAQVECRMHAEASLTLADNISLAKDLNARNLESTNRALIGQMHLQEGQYSLAKKALLSAQPLRQAHLSNDQFLLIKLNLITDGLKEKNLVHFAKLRSLAKTRQDWSALREADLYSLKASFDKGLFLHLYFGSPIKAFRHLIEREIGVKMDRSTYVLGSKKAPRLNLKTGELDGQPAPKAGRKSHQLLAVLLKDFYQPPRIAHIHSELYRSEHFNIFSGPDRIRQALHRARNWLKDCKYPVEIKEHNGFYFVSIAGDFSFRIELDQEPMDTMRLAIDRLRLHLGAREFFSAAECSKLLDCSKRSAQRLLKQAIDDGEIERLGSAQQPHGYRFLIMKQVRAIKAA